MYIRENYKERFFQKVSVINLKHFSYNRDHKSVKIFSLASPCIEMIVLFIATSYSVFNIAGFITFILIKKTLYINLIFIYKEFQIRQGKNE